MHPFVTTWKIYTEVQLSTPLLMLLCFTWLNVRDAIGPCKDVGDNNTSKSISFIHALLLMCAACCQQSFVRPKRFLKVTLLSWKCKCSNGTFSSSKIQIVKSEGAGDDVIKLIYILCSRLFLHT